MASLQSKFFRVVLRNRHLLKGKLRPEIIDTNTSLQELRDGVRKSAGKAKVPKTITVQPAGNPGRYAEWLIPSQAPQGKALLYFHGSGFVMGTSQDHRALVGKLAERCGYRALVFDYALAPEEPYPAAIHDALSIYRWMLSEGYNAADIAFIGDSAGGCIAFSTLLMLKDEGTALPAAVVALSPCTDLTCSGASHITKAKADPATPEGATKTYTTYYIGDGDPTDPYLSPLFGDLSGLPPVMIQVGEDETMLDDSTRFAERAEAAGVDTTLHVWEGMFHCFPLLAPMFPEATRAMEEINAFLHRHLDHQA